MKINSSVLTLSFVSLVVSFWNRHDLPATIDYVDEIKNEPLQKATAKAPFTVSHEGVDYRIEPQFAYDLVGMIVSYRHHDGGSRMHLRSNDHLNMLDLCVVWGDNTANPRLDKIDFYNGIFTCNFKTRDQAAWDAFDIYQISNNHLISNSPLIRNRVKDINIGDQIRISGYLASYGAEGNGMRGTSTTRQDAGDGACETIFVEAFDIVAPATSYWRLSMYGSLVLLMITLIVHFRQPYRPYANA